jgi:2-polyprenyl-3-methyl-5-hydroxy-6-metoxy-1,4-benzoquinol methylase
VADPDRFSVIGADLSATAVGTYLASTRRPVVRLSATELPFPNNSFDLVISDDLIEHLVETDEYARELMRVLRPGGWLMLSTPNLAAWFNRLGLLAGLQPAFTEVSFERIFGRPGSDIVGHLRLFTWRSVKEFFAYHGFEIVDVQGARFDALQGVSSMIDRAAQRFPAIAGNTALVARTPPDL